MNGSGLDTLEMDEPEPGCPHTYESVGTMVRCGFCGWVPDSVNLACYLNTGMWSKEWKRKKNDQ